MEWLGGGGSRGTARRWRWPVVSGWTRSTNLLAAERPGASAAFFCPRPRTAGMACFDCGLQPPPGSPGKPAQLPEGIGLRQGATGRYRGGNPLPQVGPDYLDPSCSWPRPAMPATWTNARGSMGAASFLVGGGRSLLVEGDGLLPPDGGDWLEGSGELALSLRRLWCWWVEAARWIVASPGEAVPRHDLAPVVAGSCSRPASTSEFSPAQPRLAAIACRVWGCLPPPSSIAPTTWLVRQSYEEFESQLEGLVRLAERLPSRGLLPCGRATRPAGSRIRFAGAERQPPERGAVRPHKARSSGASWPIRPGCRFHPFPTRKPLSAGGLGWAAFLATWRMGLAQPAAGRDLLGVRTDRPRLAQWRPL